MSVTSKFTAPIHIETSGMMKASLAAFVLLLPAGLPQLHPVEAPLQRTVINDNNTPAGRMTGSTLAVHLTVGRTQWFPEAEDGPAWKRSRSVKRARG